MDQTPIHDQHNPALLSLIPAQSNRVMEIGCSSGALARAFKKTSPQAHWVGMEIDPDYAAQAQRFCDQTLVADIEACDAAFFQSHRDRDCWVFGDTLEHLKDPWSVLAQIRKVIPAHGCIAACVPNAQHWSMQVRLATGQLTYQPSGLLDRTHLRWFTRQTLLALFKSQGFQVVAGKPRIFPEAQRETFLPLIGQMAKAAGVDEKQAIRDATPLQYVIRAVPI